MPANLTPQYLEAEKRYKQAATPGDKVSALEEMLAVIPKHKGTEKLQADLKSRLSKLRAELQKPHASGGKRSSLDLVEREGAGQVETVLAVLEKSKVQLISQEPAKLIEGGIPRKIMLVGTKSDLDPQHEALDILKELYGDRVPIFFISNLTGENLSEIRARIYQMLDIVRIYSKPPGKKADFNDPFVLKKGSTVLEAAAHIHKDFAERLKFAKIWGSERFEGQMVHRDHVLEEGDIVEFHL